MKLEVLRYSGQSDSTFGLLFINFKFQCYTLEDEHREVKVKHETRIPDGTYKIGVRKEGVFHTKYSTHEKIKSIHEGMLQVLDVPNFDFILIHCGNTDEDTSGCLLLGNTVNNNRVSEAFLGDSVTAYMDAYKKIIEAIKKHEPVTITYKTL